MNDQDQRDTKDAEIMDAPDEAQNPDTPLEQRPETRRIRDVSRLEENLPEELVALPLNQRPVFPSMMVPLVVPPGRLTEAMRYAINSRRGYLGFFLTRRPLDESSTFAYADLHQIGTVARVIKHQEIDGGALQVFTQVLARFRIDGPAPNESHVLVRGTVLKTQVDASDPQVRACAMAIVGSLKDLIQHNPVFADEIKSVLANFNNIDGPGRLADISTSLTTATREEIQTILETDQILPRMEKVLVLLAKENQLSQLKTRITHQIEEKLSEHQRKFFLNEQLKAIKEELGLESDDKSLDVKRFREVLAAKGPQMSEEARTVMEEELRKLALLESASSEYGVVRTRLEWLSDLPWGDLTEDDLDPVHLRDGLDRDHYGLEEVKDRIVEFCAVRRLREDRGGGIIALVGPPGTGKTSIGQSIARHLGRSFYRLSLGGMRDEAEIKGHRRTYVGALPGKLVQALRRCKSMNPVILLDEIDKLSVGLQGDPAAALLEVLDPEQNKDFLDHYLDIRVDLSRVLFITTANDLAGIPEPLRDRMEIIRLAGYIESEKLAIARGYLVGKQRQAHGLAASDVRFSDAALTSIIRDHAREAGVRHLEQLIARVCRKVAMAKVKAGDRGFPTVNVGRDDLVPFLGKPMMRDDELIGKALPGVVTGLAWTAMGGATLEVEAVASPAERGGLTLTGQLGEVMKESASLARSYLMSQVRSYGVEEDWFDRHHIHIHVPAGATPKDGPSAGATMATAMLSLALGRPVRRRFGMTGELTLTGRIYPIGGVREKMVAARRSELDLVLMPKANERDYDELPGHLRKGIEVHFVSTLDEVLQEAGLLTKEDLRTGRRGQARTRRPRAQPAPRSRS